MSDQGESTTVEDWDIDQLLADFTPPKIEAKVCTDGDLVLKIEAAELHLAGLGADDKSRPELARKILAMAEEMRTKERTFVIQGIGDLAWDTLIGKHPPDATNVFHLQAGHNTATFPQAALAACCVMPKLTLKQAEALRAKLVVSQWRRLMLAIEGCNRADDADGLGKSASALASMLGSETS